MTDMDIQLPIPELESLRQEAAAHDRNSKLAQIIARCTGRLKAEEQQREDGAKFVVLNFQNGRSIRPVAVASVRNAERLLETEFERYVFLGDYEAICSYDDGVIEAAIRPLDIRGMPTSFVWRRLFERDADGGSVESREEPRPIELAAPGQTSEVRITIGPTSRTLQALSYGPDPRRLGTSLRVSGVRLNQHDAALEILEKISNAVLFEIDVKLNLPLGLVRDRRRLTRTGRTVSAQTNVADLSFPSSEYPQQPMTLYWYARSATGMPLLQYLAYYQALEFFFPIYSQVEAHRRVRNMLKDPSFNVHRDTDITRLLSAIGPGYGRGFGGELAQLRATLQECIDANELRSFLSESAERAEHFTKDKVLSNRRLPINNPTADLRNEVADRVYDLRCKIVHTKAGEAETEVDLLLPFSRQAESLDHDIDLLQFIARRVLIASSGPLLAQLSS